MTLDGEAPRRPAEAVRALRRGAASSRAIGPRMEQWRAVRGTSGKRPLELPEVIMHTKVISDLGDERTFAVVFDQGDEVIAGLRSFATEANLLGAYFTAIGAFSD